MNDFSEIENELRALRPVGPSPRLQQAVEHTLEETARAEEPADNVIRPHRARLGWLSLGAGLAAAAALFILAGVHQPVPFAGRSSVASSMPANSTPAARLEASQFIPAGASRVVYDTRNEGLLFPQGSSQPVRRVRSRARETWQWHNPETGASLRVSYPSEEVQFIPVAGQ